MTEATSTAFSADHPKPRSLFSIWEDFWLKPASPLVPGLLRWLLGGMLVYTHYVWGLELNRFFGPQGLMQAAVVGDYQSTQFVPSLWWAVGPEMQPLVHSLLLLVLLLFTLGVATPVTSVAALVITISNSHRAPLANYGLDQILSMLTLYLTIAGAGGAFSVDRFLISWWKRKFSNNQSSSQVSFWVGPKTSRACLGLRLIQVHYCIIYFFAGTSKLQGETWWTGEAMWLSLANREYQSWDMTWLAYHPRLTEFLTHLTILWEISFAYLVWYRSIRLPYLLLGAGMHMGIVLFLGMPTFGLIMIYGYLAFLPAEWFTRAWLAICQSPQRAVQQGLQALIPQRETAIAVMSLVMVAGGLGVWRASSANPQDLMVDDLVSRAYLQEEQGDYEQAIKAITQAIEIRADQPLLFYDRAVYYERLEQWQPAWDDYAKAIELDPELQRAYNNRGLVSMRLANDAAALEDFQKAMQLNPNDSLPFQNRGELYWGQGNSQLAFEDFSQAIVRAYDRPILYLFRAEAALELGNFVQAIEDLGCLRLLDPSHPDLAGLEERCRQAVGKSAFENSEAPMPQRNIIEPEAGS